MVGFRLGMRYNLALAHAVRSAVETQFAPTEAAYVPTGFGVGFGFEYTLAGPVTGLRGILTTLPRYQVLYIPIARLLGRNDLLKLTFDCPDTLPPGVGTVVHETARGSRWHAVERDPDWHEETDDSGSDRFRLFWYNPIVGDRLRALLPSLRGVPSLNQLSLDSRNGTITVFLTPYRHDLAKDLRVLSESIFSLTA